MGDRKGEVDGPYIVWVDGGAYEGWRPTSFVSLKEAVLFNETYGSPFVITKIVDVEVSEKQDG